MESMKIIILFLVSVLKYSIGAEDVCSGQVDIVTATAQLEAGQAVQINCKVGGNLFVNSPSGVQFCIGAACQSGTGEFVRFGADGVGASIGGVIKCAAGQACAGLVSYEVVPCECSPENSFGRGISKACGTKRGESVECELCPDGYFSDGKSECKPCEAGFGSNVYKTTCTACPAGTFSGGGMLCEKCYFGYKPAEDKKSCVLDDTPDCGSNFYGPNCDQNVLCISADRCSKGICSGRQGNGFCDDEFIPLVDTKLSSLSFENTSENFGGILDMVLDSSNNLYVLEVTRPLIRKFPSGNLFANDVSNMVLGGVGEIVVGGDDDCDLSISRCNEESEVLSRPYCMSPCTNITFRALAVDSTDKIYYSTPNQIFVYDPVQRISSLLAGTLLVEEKHPDTEFPKSFSNMVFGHIESLTVDSKDNVYAADTRFNRVYKLDSSSKSVTIFAGAGEVATQLEISVGDPLFGGKPFYFGGKTLDTVQANAAQIVFPISITMDKDDSMYILEKGGLGISAIQTYNQEVRVRKVDEKNTIVTILGGGTRVDQEGAGPRSIKMHTSTSTIAVCKNGNIYFGENKSIRIFDMLNDYVYTIAGSKTDTSVVSEKEFRSGGLVSFATGQRSLVNPNAILVPRVETGKLYVGSQHKATVAGQGEIAVGLVRLVMTKPLDFNLFNDKIYQCDDPDSLGRMYMFAFKNIIPTVNTTEKPLFQLLECLGEYLEEGNRLELNSNRFNVRLNSDLMIRIRFIASQILSNPEKQSDLAQGYAARMMMVIDHQLRLLSHETTSFRGKLLPPFPPIPFAEENDEDEQVEQGAILRLDKYLETFSVGNLETICKRWIVGFTTCQCGSLYDLTELDCVPIPKDEYAFILSAVTYCSSDPNLMGKPIQASLLTRTKECVNHEVWKENSQKTIYDLMDYLQQMAYRSKSDQVGMKAELSVFSVETSSKTNELAFTISGMDDLEISTYSNPKIVGLKNLKKLDEQLADEKIISDITSDIEVMSKGLYNMTLTLQQNINQNYNAINMNLGTLGQLMSSVGNELAGQVNAGLSGIATQVQSGFTQIAETNQKMAENRAATSLVDLKQSRAVFQNSIIAIQGDPNAPDPSLKFGDAQKIQNQVVRMEENGKLIADTAKEYYVCKRDNALAEAARKRARAIFDIVTGSLGLVVEGAKMVATGGASAAAPAAVLRVLEAHDDPVKAQDFMDDANRLAEEALKKLKDQALDKIKEEKEKFDKLTPEEKIDKIGDFLEDKVIGNIEKKLLKDIISGEPSSLDGATGPIKWVGGTLTELGKRGVPFADNANKILAGAYVLKNYGKIKDGINQEYEREFAASQAAYEGIAEKTEEIGLFISQLLLEFGQVSLGIVPGYSVAESRSISFWDSIKSELEYFCKETEMYNDFLTGGRRRLLLNQDVVEEDDQRVLIGKRNLIGDRLESRAMTMNENPFANEVALRRSLGGKKTKSKCSDAKERSLAQRGSQLFEKFFTDLDITVNYGKEIHTRLMGMVGSARSITIKKLMTLNYANEISAWDTMKTTMASAQPDFVKPEFQFAMIKVERTIPQLRQPMPGVMEKTLELQQFQLNQFCKASFYHSLKRLPNCDFRMSDIMQTNSNGESVNMLGSVIRDIRADFLQGGQQQETKKTDWFRIELGDSKFIQTAFSPTLVSGPLVTEDSIYSHKLYETPELFNGCGYNGEVLNQVFIWEDKKTKKHLPIYEEKEVYVDAEQRGPFVKYDKRGRRHGFDIEVLSSRPSFKTRVHRLPDGADCNNPNFKFVDFILREDMYKLCMEDVEIEPLPLYSTYDIKLGEFADHVNKGTGEEVLVMYVQLEIQGETENCESNQFRFFKYEEEDQIVEEVEDDGVHPGVFAAVGIFCAALLTVGGVVAFRKHRAKQRRERGASFENNENKFKLANTSQANTFNYKDNSQVTSSSSSTTKKFFNFGSKNSSSPNERSTYVTTYNEPTSSRGGSTFNSSYHEGRSRGGSSYHSSYNEEPPSSTQSPKFTFGGRSRGGTKDSFKYNPTSYL